jgi:hypothetical protein
MMIRNPYATFSKIDIGNGYGFWEINPIFFRTDQYASRIVVAGFCNFLDMSPRSAPCGRGCLLALGQLLYPFRDIQVQHVYGDPAFARIIGLAADPLYERFGKGAVFPCWVFNGILISRR